MTTPLHIGFIPLVDAAALIIAVDKGFAAAEGLDVKLVREVSWSNVRDKLNIGLFDAAHLGAGGDRVEPRAWTRQGADCGAVQSGPQRQCDHGIAGAACGHHGRDRGRCHDPMATALALARVVANRRKSGAEPLTFGMTFPFSTHNYQLRFWMAAGGVDPDEDVRLWCCRRPTWWTASPTGMSMRSASARPGTRSRSISGSATSCISSPTSWCARRRRFWPSGKAGRKRMRTCWRPWSGRLPHAAEYIEDPGNRAETADVLSRPDRIGVGAEVIQRTLDGRLKISPDGQRRESGRYLLVGREGRAVPIPRRPPGFTRRWCAGGRRRCVRTRSGPPWGLQPDLYDAAMGHQGKPPGASDAIGAFAGPAFDPTDIAGHLAAFQIGHWKP